MARTIRIQIRLLRGPGAGQERMESVSFPPEGRILAGRDPHADLHLDHPTVSLSHLAIIHAQGMFWVQDLGSQNGTQLRGVPLKPHTKTPCAPGDLLVVGPFLISILDPTLDSPLGEAGSTQSLALEAVLKILSKSNTETASVTVASGPQAGSRIPIPLGRPLLIGRDPGAHLVLTDPKISHRHARVYADAEGVWLEDLQSTHGTFVDERRIFGLWKLAIGQVIRLGQTTLNFHDPAEQVLADLEAAAGSVAQPSSNAGGPLSEGPRNPGEESHGRSQADPLQADRSMEANPHVQPAAVGSRETQDDTPNADIPAAPVGPMPSDHEQKPASNEDPDPDFSESASSVWWIAGLVGGISVILAATALFVWMLTR